MSKRHTTGHQPRLHTCTHAHMHTPKVLLTENEHTPLCTTGNGKKVLIAHDRGYRVAGGVVCCVVRGTACAVLCGMGDVWCVVRCTVCGKELSRCGVCSVRAVPKPRAQATTATRAFLSRITNKGSHTANHTLHTPYMPTRTRTNLKSHRRARNP